MSKAKLKDGIDLERDELLTLSEACRLLPRQPSPATLWRWRTRGLKVNGKCVKLECIRVGARWCTTREALADFLRRSTEAASPTESAEEEQQERDPATQRRLKAAKLT